MRLAIAALVLSLAGPLARAAEEPSSAPPSKAAQNLARVLLTDKDWGGLLDRYATSLSGQLSQSLASAGEPVPDDLTGSIRKQLGDQLPYSDTMMRHAKALSDRFTRDELKKATDFYSSKAGSKVLRGLPETQAEVGEYLQGRLATVVPEIVKQVAPKALERPSPPAGSEEPGSAPPQARTPPGSGAATPESGSGSGAAKP